MITVIHFDKYFSIFLSQYNTVPFISLTELVTMIRLTDPSHTWASSSMDSQWMSTDGLSLSTHSQLDTLMVTRRRSLMTMSSTAMVDRRWHGKVEELLCDVGIAACLCFVVHWRQCGTTDCKQTLCRTSRCGWTLNWNCSCRVAKKIMPSLHVCAHMCLEHTCLYRCVCVCVCETSMRDAKCYLLALKMYLLTFCIILYGNHEHLSESLKIGWHFNLPVSINVTDMATSWNTTGASVYNNTYLNYLHGLSIVVKYLGVLVCVCACVCVCVGACWCVCVCVCVCTHTHTHTYRQTQWNLWKSNHSQEWI